ncbi:MAG: hypothetical protein JWM00_473 [Candidatus Saccharibacteria bacterium]|nr:hypothetical protein [Candidatus Saccharibacteria bacterium]
MEEKKETVVVDRGAEKRSSSGVWTVIGVVLLVLIVLYFIFNGFSMFGGGQTTPTTDVNITPPASTGQ